jgi:hypothetical protein
MCGEKGPVQIVGIGYMRARAWECISLVHDNGGKITVRLKRSRHLFG